MTLSESNPLEDVSEEVTTVLENSTDDQLREAINYAQQLLREHPLITDAVESRCGEELVCVKDHGAYTVATVVRPGETGEARGPFAYRVKCEPNIDDEGGRYKWHYLGKVRSVTDDRMSVC